MTTDPAGHLTSAAPGDPYDPEPGDFGEGPGGEEETGPGDAQMRAELRDRGHNPPTRGRLGADWVALWESGEGLGDSEEPWAAAVGAAAAVTDSDFAGAHHEQVTPERPPKKPKAAGGWRARLGLDDTGPGKRKSGREKTGPRTAKPKHDRVPLDRLGEALFDGLARATRTLDPPLSRCFALESPIAGMMAEDALAGTLVDRGLQPLARAQAKSRVLLALFGMPLGIIGLEQAQTLPPRQRALREAVILPTLRECAVMWIEFAGDKLAEKADRDAKRGPLYEEADELIKFLLYGQPPGDGVPGAQQVDEHVHLPGDPPCPGCGWGMYTPDDQAAAHAQRAATPGFMGFASAAEPPQYAHPYPPAPAYPAAQIVPRQ